MQIYHRALIDLMMLAAAADGGVNEDELDSLSRIVSHTPVFAGFDPADIAQSADDVALLLGRDDGLEAALAGIKSALPPPLRETAYALAVEVVAADLCAEQAELSLLTMIRETLEIAPETAEAVERAARVRFRVA